MSWRPAFGALHDLDEKVKRAPWKRASAASTPEPQSAPGVSIDLRRARELRRQLGAGALTAHLGHAVVPVGAIQRARSAADGAHAGEALGTGASIAPRRALRRPRPDGPLFTSTGIQDRVPDGGAARRQAAERHRRFTGLHAPKWPAEILGEISPARQARR